MRLAVLIALLAACATNPGSEPSTPTSTSPAPRLDDASALARAHRFFDAVDRRDIRALRAIATQGFLHFEDGRQTTIERLASVWDPSIPARTRRCTDEVIHRSERALVYVGDCAEHQPAHGDREAQDYQGWNTVVMVPDSGTWKVVLWQWQRSGVEGERVVWNDMYRRGTGYTEEPNELLVRTVKDLEPGRALVLAMGQGRNALHLAAEGWKVTGIDISDVGIAAAREAARKRGLELDAVLGSVDEFDFGTERWDLVTMIYAGGDPEWIRKAQDGLAPGGLFVLEHFYDNPRGGPGFKPGELSRRFAGWEIVREEIVEDLPDWGRKPARLMRFVARKP